MRRDCVAYFPTVLDAAAYPAVEHSRRGCAGAADLDRQPLDRSFAGNGPGRAGRRRGPSAKAGIWRAVCDGVPPVQGIDLTPRPWSMESEIVELADADIGISWLPDHPWSLGKCGLKVLRYLAAGLPVVANPVGIHGELVLHGKTGFLATSPRQWSEAVCRLAASPELRQEMGRAGRHLVLQRYAVGVWAEPLIQLLEKLAPVSVAAGPPPIAEEVVARRELVSVVER